MHVLPYKQFRLTSKMSINSTCKVVKKVLVAGSSATKEPTQEKHLTGIDFVIVVLAQSFSSSKLLRYVRRCLVPAPLATLPGQLLNTIIIC